MVANHPVSLVQSLDFLLFKRGSRVRAGGRDKSIGQGWGQDICWLFWIDVLSPVPHCAAWFCSFPLPHLGSIGRSGERARPGCRGGEVGTETTTDRFAISLARHPAAGRKSWDVSPFGGGGSKGNLTRGSTPRAGAPGALDEASRAAPGAGALPVVQRTSGLTICRYRRKRRKRRVKGGRGRRSGELLPGGESPVLAQVSPRLIPSLSSLPSVHFHCREKVTGKSKRLTTEEPGDHHA